MTGRSVVASISILASLLGTAAAHAVDGVIEINQAKALAGGVTGTDGGNFPVTIDKGGSYRLTSNLVVPADTNGIVVSIIGAAADPSIVDIDLNGFTISSTVSCSWGGGEPASLGCTASIGPGYGIQAVVGQVRVHDGVVQGFRGHCIDNSITNKSIELRNLDLKWCAFGANAQHGVLENINAVQNQLAGIFATRSVLHRIHAQENAGDGISISESALDLCTSISNTGHGIGASGSSQVNRCVSLGSVTGYGLNCPAGTTTCGYAGNTFKDNDQGDVFNGVPLGINLCSGAVCP